MRFPWSREQNSTGLFGRPTPDPTPGAGQKCPGLAKVLEKVLRVDKPDILDLGPFCGATAVFLADRGARVSVEEFEPPAERVVSYAGSPDEADEPPPPLRIDQPDGKFHLVLVWELCDFVPTDRLAEFGAELHRVLVEGGWTLLLSSSDPPTEGHASRHPPRYRVVGDDSVVREDSRGASHKRYRRNPRDIERALSPLSVQGIHLQRNQLREFLLVKRAGKA